MWLLVSVVDVAVCVCSFVWLSVPVCWNNRLGVLSSHRQRGVSDRWIWSRRVRAGQGKQPPSSWPCWVESTSTKNAHRLATPADFPVWLAGWVSGLSVCLSVYLSVCLSVGLACLLVCLGVCLFVCLSVWLGVFLFVCLFWLPACLYCLPGWLSGLLSVLSCLSVCMSVHSCLSVRVCLYVSVCLSVCLWSFHVDWYG